ncbi:MAG: glycosyltransferase family 39 protein [Elusimicrobia bacterium]|nr:glycosyltransferase family 39 protein [Elusimicrobiota bacterium]
MIRRLCFVVWAVVVLRAYYAMVGFSPAALWTVLSSLVPSPLPVSTEALLRAGGRGLAAMWVLTAAWGAGWFALRPWGMAWRDRFAAAALSFGLGLGILAYGILGLGWAGFLQPWVIRLVLGVLGAAGVFAGIMVWKRGLNESIPAASAAAPANDNLGSRWRAVFACLLTGAAVALVPFVLAPETFWDAMVYHVGLPHLYLLEGRMVPTPANIYSGNVMTVQMLFTAALAAGGPVAAKLVNAGMGLACCLFFCSWARQRRLPGAGLLASALFFLCPLVFYEFFRTSVGLGWAFFQLAAFHCVMAAAEEPESSSQRKKWWSLAGVFLGLAMSTKYPAWLLPCALILAAALSRVRSLGLPAIRVREAALCLGVAVLVVAPWLGRNLSLLWGSGVPVSHGGLRARRRRALRRWPGWGGPDAVRLREARRQGLALPQQ